MSMDGTGSPASGARIVILSALSAFLAPLVFVGIIVLRKVERRLKVHFRSWSRRFEHEIARWT